MLARLGRREAGPGTVATIRYEVAMMSNEPIHDLAHLGHVEILTPKPDKSLGFFTELMGMTVSARDGDSVYLRGWDDYELHTLKLTAAKTAGIGHYAFRAASPAALERRV